jgi:hypothetical protein
MQMADAVAGRTKSALNGKQYPMHRYTLKLNDLFHEIIPVGQWHLRTAGAMAFPVMGDILPFQHRAQRKLMTEKRDKHHDHDYWSSTSLAFAHQVHPLQNRSYWAAARRTLIAFDWVGQLALRLLTWVCSLQWLALAVQ